MPPFAALFSKAFIQAHSRRMKNGNTVQIAAYYDKRVKKLSQHAPDHTHDVSHLSDDDKAKFSNMHKEQHAAHYYEGHALGRKLEAEKQLLAVLERSAKRHEEAGDKKSVAAVHNKIYALKQHINRHEKMLSHIKGAVEGIGKMKDKFVSGSGGLKDDPDKTHAHYVGKMGERFKSNKQDVVNKPQGGKGTQEEWLDWVNSQEFKNVSFLEFKRSTTNSWDNKGEIITYSFDGKPIVSYYSRDEPNAAPLRGWYNDKVTESETKNELQKKLPKGTVAGSSQDIKSLAEKVVANEIPANEKRAVRYAMVSDKQAEKLKIATGLDLKGYKHTVDSFGIRHAISQHGDAKKEAKRGQIAVTTNDISLIPEIVKSPDNIEPAGKDANGNELIRYSKKYKGMVFYVEEVREGRLELVSKTMWKTLANVAMPENSRQLTPKTAGGNLPHDDKSIAQPSENTSPQEGERNAEGLFFRDGRWHRDNENEDQKPMKNYGWDRVKLYQNYSIDELNALRKQVETQHKNPLDKDGHPVENGTPTIYLYDKKGRPKLDNISWAITYHLGDIKRNEPKNDDSPKNNENKTDYPLGNKKETTKQAVNPEPKKVIKLTMDEWKKVHKDFKGIENRQRAMMAVGGLYPVEIVKDPEQSSKGKPIELNAALQPKQAQPDDLDVHVDHAKTQAEDKAQWARLHQEQHVLHHVDKAAHERRIKEASGNIEHHNAKAAHHEAQRDIARKGGDNEALSHHNKMLAHHHNRAQDWTNRRSAHERKLAKVNGKLEGIKAAKEALWAGSGEVGERIKGDVQTEIRLGSAAMQKVIRDHINVKNAMYREGVGDVSFYYGTEGDSKKGFRGGKGIAKIIAKRNSEGHDGEDVANMMVNVIAKGVVGKTYGPAGGERVNISHQDHTAVLSHYKDGDKDTWLLTGWKDDSTDGKEGVNPSNTYASNPSGIQDKKGAADDKSIAQPDKKASGAENPTVDKSDIEKQLRDLWTVQGVSKERQDELIAQVAEKAKPGAKVGAFTIPENPTEPSPKIIVDP